MTAKDSTSRMMGYATPGDQKVSIPIRDWNALRLALWRSRVGWETAMRAAVEIVDRCEHVDGCPGTENESEPCLPDYYEHAGTTTVLVSRGCKDREMRMSALVVLNAARMFAPVDARRLANDPYFAPSREYFSEVLATLAATQLELDALHASGAQAAPGSNEGPLLPIQRAPTQLLPEET